MSESDRLSSHSSINDPRMGLLTIISELMTTGPVGKTVMGILGVLVLVGLWWVFRPIDWLRAELLDRDVNVILLGPGVDQLSPGMKIVTGQVEVGSVKAIDVTDGQPSATLELRGQYARQFSVDSQFIVSSLNPFLPGNIGVRVEAAQNSSGVKLENGAKITAHSRLLPAQVPSGFVVLAGSGMLALIVLGYAAKVVRNLAVTGILLGVFLVIILFLARAFLVT